MPHVPLAGSQPPARPDKPVERAAPGAVVRLSVVLRPPDARTPQELASRRRRLQEEHTQLYQKAPRDRKYVTREAKAEPGAGRGRDIERLRAFCNEYQLRLEEEPGLLALGQVVVSGSVSNVERAFEVRLFQYPDWGGTYLWHDGPAHVPVDLEDVVEAVIGLHTVPMQVHAVPPTPSGTPVGLDPREMACAYDFPPGDGQGQCIAIILLGGGYLTSDLTQYFEGAGLHVPEVTLVEVGGQINNPASAASISGMLAGNPPDPQTLWTVEAALDIELVGAFVNCAHIVVYLGQNDNQGKLEAFSRAMTDPFGASVISCSFGSFEKGLPTAYLDAMDDLYVQAGLAGITVCVSSGDQGDGADASGPRVRFPASSPNVLACGGTHATFTSTGALNEVVWNETLGPAHFSSGGGVSGHFGTPAFQAGADVPGATGERVGRGVPDVAAKADILSGYSILVRGIPFPMGGTSAAAPLWASLALRLNQNLGARVGHLAPMLYTPVCASALRDVTVGSSGGAFAARAGWDACTGLGSPKGTALLTALSSSS
jgi:kumamolisin